MSRSQSVRSHWGVLMRSGAAQKDYTDLQIHNVVTLATRVRITLLRVNFSVQISVISYQLEHFNKPKLLFLRAWPMLI
jgi:hypothetical protein